MNRFVVFATGPSPEYLDYFFSNPGDAREHAMSYSDYKVFRVFAESIEVKEYE